MDCRCRASSASATIPVQVMTSTTSSRPRSTSRALAVRPSANCDATHRPWSSSKPVALSLATPTSFDTAVAMICGASKNVSLRIEISVFGPNTRRISSRAPSGWETRYTSSADSDGSSARMRYPAKVSPGTNDMFTSPRSGAIQARSPDAVASRRIAEECSFGRRMESLSNAVESLLSSVMTAVICDERAIMRR